jgi:hypothetical protein
MVEHLPHMCEALHLIPISTKNSREGKEGEGKGGEGHLWKHN